MNTKADAGNTPDLRQLLRDPAMLVAFGFGSGLSPKAPGTAGTLLALVLFPLIAGLPLPWYLGLLAATVVIGTLVSDIAARRLGVHDHGGIVIDEIAGLWLALCTFPATWPWMLAGFVLFRLFDIWKPWPIRTLDRRLGGGFGIMADDLVAGVFAWLILVFCQQIALPWLTASL